MGIQQPDIGQVTARRLPPVLVRRESLGSTVLGHLRKRLCSHFS